MSDELRISDHPTTSKAQVVSHIGSIGSGKAAKRLTIGNDKIPTHDSLKIAAKATKDLNPFEKMTFVKINRSDTSINIRSAAKRLGLSQKEVRDIAKLGSEALLGAFNARNLVLSQYENIVKNYELQKSTNPKKADTLAHKQTRADTGLTPKVLLNTIHEGLKHLKDQENYQPVAFSHDLKMMYLPRRGNIGSGAFGVVRQAFDFISRTFIAVKEMTATDKDELLSAANEREILLQLNHPAFMPAPSEVTLIKNTTRPMEKAVIQTKLMDADLNLKLDSNNKIGNPKMQEFCNLSMRNQFEVCHNLVNGLAYMHSQGIVHKDIKPANCLMEITKNKDQKEFKFVFADTGSAEKLNIHTPIPRNQYNNEPTEARTSYYTPHDKSSQAQGDVFAFTLSLVEIFTKNTNLMIDMEIFSAKGSLPITNPSDEYTNILKQLTDNGVPEKMAQLLLKGIGPNDQRPTAAEFKQQYDDLMNDPTTWAK